MPDAGLWASGRAAGTPGLDSDCVNDFALNFREYLELLSHRRGIWKPV